MGGGRSRDRRSSTDCIVAALALPESGKDGADLKALSGCSTSLGRHWPFLSLRLRICGFPVKVILQTQQRLKGRERKRGERRERERERERESIAAEL